MKVYQITNTDIFNVPKSRTANAVRLAVPLLIAAIMIFAARPTVAQNTAAKPSVTDTKGFDRGTGTGEPTKKVADLLRLMKSADDAYNERNYAVFLDKLHSTDVVVHQIGAPTTVGRPLHRKDMDMWLAGIPDMRVHNNPYDIQFGQGDWTVAMGKLSGTFTKPLTLPDGTIIQPTGKAFTTFFTTIAQWKDKQMVAEYVLFDAQDIMKQVGIAKQ